MMSMLSCSLLIYFEPEEQSIWVQYQLWSWSSKNNADAKCVIASDVEERVSAYYEGSVTDSLIELLVMCSQLFPSLSESDSPA